MEQTKKVRNKALTANDYQRLSQKEHIYKVTDTYLGSDMKTEREEWVYNIQKKCLEKKLIVLPPAIERLFMEILSNAADNVFNSRLSNIDPGIIDVIITDSYITIKNGGNPIPVEINEKEKVYVPEMIFGMLLTSSNYDASVVRYANGRNGLGAKLNNIFSKIFKIEVGDNIRKKKYVGEWQNNMDIRLEPKITKYKGENYVQVSYLLDFNRFGYEKYSEEAFEIFYRLVLDVSLTCKIPVKINGELYDCSNIKYYSKLLYPEEGMNEVIEKSIVYEYKKDNTSIELCAMDTPDNSEVLSYVNGMITKEGGVHVNSVLKALSKDIIPMFTETKKGKEKDKKDKRQGNIKISDISPHISLIIVCRLPDPKFSSQSKTKLSDPEINFTIPSKIMLPVKKWKLMERLDMTLQIKQFNVLKDTDGKKKRHISNIKGDDANYAGTNKSRECTLYIVEGKSAMGYAVKAISTINNGRDFHGILPIRGKLLNVMNANANQIAENEELKEMKKMLGLKEGYDYTNEENFNTLRYGYLVILTDADDDGKHITGLVLNFFFCRFPSLLSRGFLFYMKTPIIRVVQGTITKKFYSQKDYEEWKNNTPNFSSFTHRYYKGLGTSRDSDIKDDFKEPKIIMCVYDDTTESALRLAFDYRLANERKLWISTWKDQFQVDDVKYIPISTFINTEFILFSISNLHRSIPKFMDGLKISQRKVLWCAFLHWKSKLGGLVKSPKELKVAQFANMAAEKTNYHHGEMCLAETIISMAQDFVGANNMSYFTQDGQFGSRTFLGADAAQPRYPYTRPMEWLPYVFRLEDFPLMEFQEDEGQKCEPISFLPIVPMCLINGCLGIGTGHSTFIPNCSPIEIIDWYINKLNNEQNKEILPWYRNYKGDIKVRISDLENDEFFDENTEQTKQEKTVAMITVGKYRRTSKGMILITEIPIGISINKYKQYLDKLREDKIISSYRNLSKENEPRFEIITEKNLTLKLLKLTRSYGLTNMVLLDNNNVPKKFKSIENILEEFYKNRKPIYELRKNYQIKEFEKVIKSLSNKKKFISFIINGTIDIYNKKKFDILLQMKSFEIPEELFTNLRLSSLSEDEMKDLENQIKELEQQKLTLSQTSSEKLWINDLISLKSKYIEIFGNELVDNNSNQKRIKQDNESTDDDSALELTN
jgi:DNA topoisomerase-2